MGSVSVWIEPPGPPRIFPPLSPCKPCSASSPEESDAHVVDDPGVGRQHQCEAERAKDCEQPKSPP